MIRVGTKVEWDWGKGTACGTVEKIHRDEVNLEIDGSPVTRRGSKDNPAYRITQQDGSRVLELRSEIRRTE